MLVKNSPASSDTFSTTIAHPGKAHVLSATVDKKSGKRNEYELTYCWTGDRFCIVGCGCLGFLSAGACRHAIGLFDALNLPLVKQYMVSSPKTELLKAEASAPCVQCRSPKLSILLYIGGKVSLSADACPKCHRVIIH